MEEHDKEHTIRHHKTEHRETHHQKVEHNKTKRNTKLLVIAIALGLLIIISGVQAVELVGLKNKLNTEITTLAASSKTKVSTSSGGSLQNNLENLPGMVGGC